MKWSKKWVAAVMLLPAVYLTSCGPGNNDGNNSDTITTQSAPPSDENSSTSDSRNMGDTSLSSPSRVDTSTSIGRGTDGTGATGVTTESGTTGSTGATGNTGTASGNTGVSSSDRTTTTTATGETRKSRTTGTKARSYRRSGSTQRKTTTENRTTSSDRSSDRTTTDRTVQERDQNMGDTASSVESSLDTAASRVRDFGDTTASRVREFGDTAASRVGELGDTAARRMGRLGDTLASKADELGDTTMNRVDRFGDTAASRLREMGDSSTMNRSGMDTASTAFDSTRGRQGNISGMTEKERTGNFQDTTDPETGDTSRTISTMGTGMNFTPSVFIPEQIRSNYAEIKLARMAIDKSRRDDVKQIAKTLENDHNAVVRELQTLGRSATPGTDTLPTSENDMARQHMDMMRNLSGTEFDRQWLQHMHMMHDQKIRMLEQAQTNNSIEDADLRAWVEKTLPTLRKHRDMLAQAMSSENR